MTAINERQPCIIFYQTNSRPVDQLVKYMIDVAMGMHYIAEKGLIHRVCVYMCMVKT